MRNEMASINACLAKYLVLQYSDVQWTDCFEKSFATLNF